MRLYLVRHARPENVTDTDPPLGTEGIEEAKMLGRLFADLHLPPESLKIISSPLQRARQTTTHICQGIAAADEVYTFPKSEEWSPSNLLKNRLMRHLKKITREEGCSEIIVVGHFDYLSKSLAWLVGHDALSFPNPYGATACLTCDLAFGQGTGVPDWLVVPVVLVDPQDGVNAEASVADQ